MRHILITIFIACVAIGSYVLGYKNGGRDFSYFQELTDGMITATVMESNKTGERSSQVVLDYTDYRISRALWSHIENSEKVSVFAPYLIPNFSKEVVESRLGTIINYRKKYGYDIGCNEPVTTNKEFAMPKEECYALQNKVNAIVSLHSNKSLKAQPSAAGTAPTGAALQHSAGGSAP